MISGWKAGLALLAAVAGAAVAQVPDRGGTTPVQRTGVAGDASNPGRPQTAQLTKADADAWLDGFLPYALQRNDIAGAVVLVVKDGQILTQKGYGYADVKARKKMDPATTLFRPGSMSKLFTWTSVMQLVEQGKLDLDADVNRYLDFKIPPYQGKPITLREMMSHVAGFEEAAGGLIVDNPGDVPSIRDRISRWVPRRIFAPGTTPAYSNYATALAGYIVQRVSGQDYYDYVDNHIFRPLGMNHTTMRQPLPANLQPFMSKGYDRGSAAPKPFELLTLPPAGVGTSSATDLAKFMIAHLNDGAGLLRPETARLMHNSPYRVFPKLPAMSLGWIEILHHSRRIISHGGDTPWFHTGLWLIPEEKVGLLISVNSAGAAGAGTLRDALLDQFMKRYFPDPSSPALVPASDRQRALEDARAIRGNFWVSRRAESDLHKAVNFFRQTRVTADENGVVRVGEAQSRWEHIGPLLWRNPETNELMSAKAEGGRVMMFAQSFPASVWMRVPWYEDAGWLRPFGIAGLVILLLAALAWPLGVVQRRYYQAERPVAAGRELGVQRATAGLAAMTLVLFGFWFSLVTNLRTQMLPNSVYLLQLATIIVLPGLFGFAFWRLWLAIKARSRISIVWSAAIALSSVIILWGSVIFHLISWGVAQ